MHEGKSPLGKPRAYPVSLASGKPHLVRLSLFGFGLSELGSALKVIYELSITHKSGKGEVDYGESRKPGAS